VYEEAPGFRPGPLTKAGDVKWVSNGGVKAGGIERRVRGRGPGRKPGASSYTLTRLSLSLERTKGHFAFAFGFALGFGFGFGFGFCCNIQHSLSIRSAFV